MHINKKAFTLIELLVVVLIIGILAAVALPQYQRSVEKSAFSEAITNLNSLHNAGEIYMLSNGDLQNAGFDSLDITFSVLKTTNKRYGQTDKFIYNLVPDPTSSGIHFSAIRKPSHEKYVLYRMSYKKTFCCWFADKYESLCRSAGLEKIISTVWYNGSLGCVSNF